MSGDVAPRTASAEPGITPRAAVGAFARAGRERRWQDAAAMLSLTESDPSRAVVLAERLFAVLDHAHLLDTDHLSDAPEGRRDDGLAADVEQVGTLPAPGGAAPVRLRLVRGGGIPVWRFSPPTVARVDAWYAALPDRWIRDRVSGTRLEVLLQPGALQVRWWHWLAFPVLAVLAVALAAALRLAAGRLLRPLTARTRTPWDDRVVATIAGPLMLATGVLLFAIGAVLLDLTSDSTALLTTVLRPTMALALFWGCWRLAVLGERWALLRPWALANASTRSLLVVGSRMLRGAILVLGALAIIASSGYPVGTMLAGLGIGALALALGAQKTLEHVFGTIALAIDQPFRIGDFVRVDDVVGTVEQVGLRSTRIRTLDRTIVSFPNGRLADQRVESFQARDRMRLAATVGLTYDTTRTQMTAVIAGLTRVLQSHPRVWPDGINVHFAALGSSSLDIEVMAWFRVADWNEFQRCRQEVLLDFLHVVDEAGTSFAFPTRTLHVVGPAAGDVAST